MRFIGYNSIQTCFDSYHILLLSNLHNNVAPIQKNQGDKLHHVIVALIALALLYHFNPILPGGGGKICPPPVFPPPSQIGSRHQAETFWL